MTEAQQKKGLLNCWPKLKNIHAFYFLKISNINKKSLNKIHKIKIKKIYQIEEKKILKKIMILMI
jgi:hypothetical protein